MTKERAKIYVAFVDGNEGLLIATVILRGYDLYTACHRFPLTGKHSYHESGASHSDNDLVGLRTRGEPGVSLQGLRGYLCVGGFGGGGPPELAAYQPKPDKPRTKTLILPPPVNVWGLDIWAVEVRRSTLADKIIQTPPWPKSEIFGSFVVDWTDPLVVVTVWQGTDESPYEVVKRYPPIPGEVPYVIIPAKWAGTWLYDASKISPARQQRQREAEEFIRLERERKSGA
jgi:hypothetical protein